MQGDELLVVIHNDTLAIVKMDRTAPLFVRLFPEPVSKMVRLSLEPELPVLRALHRKLHEPETPTALRKAHAKALERVIALGEEALEERAKAQSEAGRIAARVVAWKEGTNTLLLLVEGALQQVAVETKRDREWAGTFFPVADHKPKKKNSSRPPPPAPAPA
jgi:hypothetical protein